MSNFTSFLRIAFLWALLVALLPQVYAQTHLVKDISKIPNSAIDGVDKEEVVELNGTVFFLATTKTHGTELWKTNGTPATTMLVKDIRLGNQGSYPNKLTVANGMLFFSANDGLHGRELWKSDGTPEGTVMVKDMSIYDGDPYHLTALGSILLFTANDTGHGNHGAELWMTDGTEEGTKLVKDIAPGSNYALPQRYARVGNVIYFTASDGVTNYELWKTDGTADGTVLVKDIRTGSGASSPDNLTNVNGKLFFDADDGINGRELWTSDGTSAGTKMVHDIVAGSGSSSPSKLKAVNTTLFFTAYTAATGTELWKSDGTVAGTVMVKDINPGSASGAFYMESMAVSNNVLYFTGLTESTGLELWKSDGTAGGTVMVKEFLEGTEWSVPAELTDVNGTLYFTANTIDTGRELWKSDGTEAGTLLAKDIFPGDGTSGPEALTALNGRLYFFADDGIHGKELWKGDGTPASTVMVKDIASGNIGSEIDYDALEWNGELLFWAKEENDVQVWKSDGTGEGTTLWPVNVDAESLYRVGDVLYFVAYDSDAGKDFLFKKEGQNEAVKIGPGFTQISQPSTHIGGVIYFSADDGVHGRELWKSDGTSEGTVMVKDINAGSGSSNLYEITNFNGVLYFQANDGVHGAELWKCDDGTEAGTIMVKDIVPGSGSSSPWGFIYFNDAVYFGAETPQTARELWKTDGTAAGTVLIKDIYEGNSGHGFSGGALVLNNTLYFRGGDVATGFGLWKSNGTAETTVMVKDIVEGPGHSWVSDLYKVNDIIYFTANDDEHGYELWKTDGTAEGTMVVRDISPGTENTYPSNFVSRNNTLFFVWNGQLWKSEGGPCNTLPLTNTADVIVTDYMQPVIVGEKFFFVGITEENGEELWYYDFSNANTPGCTQTITFDALESQTYGQSPYELVATASSGLTVTFTSSNPDVATVNGTIITITGAGETTITATQPGDNDYSSATPVAYTLTVDKAVSTLSLNGLFHTYDGATKSVSVTTTPLSLEGVLITYSQNGVAVEPLNAGTYDVIVTLHNSNYSADAVTGTLTIAKAPQTLVLETVIVKAYGDQPFELGATATSGLNIAHTSSNTNVATVNGNVVTIVGAGNATITAMQNGNENYEAAQNKESVLTVNKKSQFLTFNSLAEKTIGDPSFTLEAGSSIGFAVTYTSSNASVATISGNTVTIVGAGNTTITAAQAGDNNHNAAPNVEQVLTVKKKSQTITFDALDEVYLGDASFSLSATSSSGLAVTYTSSDPNVAAVTGNTVTIVGNGETLITATQSGNAEYAAASPIEQVLLVRLVTDAEESFDDAVDVYPNPASDFVMIETVEYSRSSTLRLLNSQGGFVSAPQAIPVSDLICKVEVTHLAPGVYYLQIINGATTFTKRIVKK